MIGILTEKPSAARNFAKALGGMSGTYQGEAYVITSARGHLYEYVMPDQQVDAQYQQQYVSWDIRNLPWEERLFHWKRQKLSSASDTLKQIKQTLSACSEVVIASDVDPSGEGELLAWEILDELNIRNKKFTRMYFTDESEKELQKAFRQRKVLPPMQQDMDYVKAEFRTRWDMLSMQFTRIATYCVGNRAVLRQGRLKSAMVQIVGNGLKAVQEYKRVPFYMNKFRDDHGVVYTNPEEPRFSAKEQVPQVYHSSDVVLDGTSMMATAPPKLMDLAALSSRLAPMGFAAKEVLNVYQKMYESQIVSYPRTEDKVITPEQFNDLLPLVDQIAAVVGVDARLLTHRTPRKTHVKTGGAHGANRPGLKVPPSLQALASFGDCAPKIYELLAKNYLAMLCEDYQYEQQRGHVKDYPKFVGTASVPKSAGWKLVFDDDVMSDETENQLGLGSYAEPYIAEGANPKPPTPTMKWLMKQLEKNDVGTGATRTSTYADVTSTKTKYPLLVEKKGKLSMSEYGQMSYVLLKDTVIGDVKTTEKLQQQMRDIAAGKVLPEACLREMQDYVRHDMEVMQRNAVTYGKDWGKMSETQQKEKYEGIWHGKQVRFSREWGGHRFTDEECERLCNGETIVLRDLKSKKGSTYSIQGRLNDLEYNGHPYVGFENLGFPQEVPKSWAKHTFTEDERLMLEAGKEIYVEGFVSKKGNVFSCYVKYGKTKDGSMGIVPNFDRK